jgi:alpha-glucosidase
MTSLRAITARLVLGSLAVVATPLSAQAPLQVASPDGRNVVTVEVRDGALHYSVKRDGRDILLPSRLGFEFRGAPSLRDSLRITGSAQSARDTTWTQPWGEVARVPDNHRQLEVTAEEATALKRQFRVVFRAFNDGVAFRYELPAQANLGEFAIQEELTEFSFAGNGRAWWIASDRQRLDRSEQLYSAGPLSTLDSVQTPLTIELFDGPFVALHEADLSDYARMFLAGRGMENRTLRAALAPWADGVKVRGRTPFNSPWRTIQLADRAADLVPSVLGLNLNPPSRIANTS